MNQAVKEQLRAYTKHFETHILGSEIPGGPEGTPVASTSASNRARVAYALAIVAVVLTLVGVSIVLSPDEPTPAASIPPPVTTTPQTSPTPTTGPTRSTTTTVLESSLFTEWTNVPGPDGASETRIPGVLTTDNGVFVYFTADWIATSTDGVDWERTDFSGGFTHTGQCSVRNMVLVCASGGGAVGREGQPIEPLPSFIEVSQPDGTMSSFRIDGDITTIAIGGQGILAATVDNRLDQEVLLGLTPEEEAKLRATRVEDGVLYADFTDGTSKRVDLAELGIEPADLGKTIMWFSQDGTDWSELSTDAPDNLWSLVGARDGFYGLGELGAWFSENGQTWEHLEGVTPGAQLMLTSDGRPIAVGSQAITYLDEQPLQPVRYGSVIVGASPLVVSENGLVAGRLWDEAGNQEQPVELWYSDRGGPFAPQDVPSQMAEANVSGMWMPMGAALPGDRFLLMLFKDEFEPSFWVKDFSQR